MGTHKHHRYLTGARKAKADEFYTTYDAIPYSLMWSSVHRTNMLMPGRSLQSQIKIGRAHV